MRYINLLLTLTLTDLRQWSGATVAAAGSRRASVKRPEPYKSVCGCSSPSLRPITCFLTINVSKSSVATCAGSSGIFSNI